MASRPKRSAPSSTSPARRATAPKLNGPSEASTAPIATAPAPTDDEVRVAAYHKWVAAGCPPGDDMRFWFEAERELRGSLN